jgi:gamma-glutamyltranspeptidase / glutathione hydrolase
MSMRLMIRLRPLLVAFLVLFIQPAAAAQAPLPEKGGFMVVAAHELAAKAGYEILNEGGSAVDAAIAVQLVLTLVEPQSSGIGGGALMLHWSAEKKTLEAYDGREKAPAHVRPEHFLNGKGEPLKFREAVLGGKSVGVPGVIAMLEMAHREHGRLPWARLFEPAIELAEKGFPISPRLHKLMNYLVLVPPGFDAGPYFSDRAGRPLPVGHMLKNPAYAKTLRRIAKHGAAAFYEGPLARAIVERVRNAPLHPGPMTLEDLRGYKPVKREPVCRLYRIWLICGFPPPSSGGIAIHQILGMLERFDLASLMPATVQAVHLIAEASRLAYADRNLYVADADYIGVPVEGMLDEKYLKSRSGLINPAQSMGEAEAGKPWKAPQRTPDTSPEYPGTSHASIVDADGNVVSITMTIEAAFGSQLMVGGFLLNNELTDFSFTPSEDGRPVANAPQPGKRPRSSMSPTIVFDRKGRHPVLAIGSAGGSRIPLEVVKTLIAVLDWKLPLDQAIALPHWVNRNGPTLLEKGTDLEVLKPALEKLGHEVKTGETSSSLHGILFTEDGLAGAADPRREGVALGGVREAQARAAE